MKFNPIRTEKLYDKKSLFILGCASLAVWLTTTVLGGVFEVDLDNYKWIGLIVALFISYIGIFQTGKIEISKLIVAFFNGLLIYIAASGIDSINEGINKGESNKSALFELSWNKPWWRTQNLESEIRDLKSNLFDEINRKHELSLKLEKVIDSYSLNHQHGIIKDQQLTDSLSTLKVIIDNLAKENYLLEKSITQASEDNFINKSENLDTSVYEVTRKEISGLINVLIKLNQGLVKTLDEYTNTGTLKSQQQLNAYEQANQKALFLKSQINDYNKNLIKWTYNNTKSSMPK